MYISDLRTSSSYAWSRSLFAAGVKTQTIGNNLHLLIWCWCCGWRMLAEAGLQTQLELDSADEDIEYHYHGQAPKHLSFNLKDFKVVFPESYYWIFPLFHTTLRQYCRLGCACVTVQALSRITGLFRERVVPQRCSSIIVKNCEKCRFVLYRQWWRFVATAPQTLWSTWTSQDGEISHWCVGNFCVM